MMIFSPRLDAADLSAIDFDLAGARADQSANLKSASKTIMSALIGVALDRGILIGVNQTLDEFFPAQLADDENARTREISIEDLLTMRSGLESARHSFRRR